eukprot:s3363_g2.t1
MKAAPEKLMSSAPLRLQNDFDASPCSVRCVIASQSRHPGVLALKSSTSQTGAMPPKKPAGTKMSMAELNSKFGGSVVDQMLPSQSVGKDFGKSKGKGLRDIDGGKEEEWRSSGPRKGKGKGDSEPSRADTGDWRGGARDGPGDRGGFGDRGDRFGDRDRGGKGRGDGEPSRADAGDWRSGGGRQDGPRDRDRDGGGGGFRRENRDDHTQAGKDDDWRGNSGRRGGPERSSAPSAPVQMPGQGKYAKMDGERKRDDDDRLARQRDNDRRMEEELGTKI